MNDNGTIVLTISLQPDMLAALDKFILERDPGISHAQGAERALHELFSQHGYLATKQEGLRPEELNAANDD